MRQDDLNKYFSTTWRSNLAQYEYSGYALIDKVKPEELVLDVGCGFNEFKQHIPNLVGVDPANDLADVKLPIEFFAADNDNNNKYITFSMISTSIDNIYKYSSSSSSINLVPKFQNSNAFCDFG